MVQLTTFKCNDTNDQVSMENPPTDEMQYQKERRSNPRLAMTSARLIAYCVFSIWDNGILV